MKIVTIYVARRDLDSSAFADWFLDEHAQQVLDHTPGLRRYIVNLVDARPPESPHFSGLTSERPRNAYDVTTEMWFDSLDEFTDVAARYDSVNSAVSIERALAERTRRTCSYLVDETYQILKEHPVATLGERHPALKMISMLLWNLPGSRARDFWREHAARALPYHTGVSRYVQNWVIRSLSPYPVPLHGIAELFWPTEEDFRDRFFSSDEGADIVRKDVLHQRESNLLFASEYLLKGSSQPTGLQANFLSYISH